MITLVLGGVRSGKSRFAEQEADRWLADQPKGKRLYIATAQVYEEEMRGRIEKHKNRRGADWRTIEEPLYLTKVLKEETGKGTFILVDCLTLWLTNLLLKDAKIDAAMNDLCAFLKKAEGEIVLVSNEVGHGIVPENKLAREFCDIQGLANQHLAETADRVVLITAGIPLVLKG